MGKGWFGPKTIGWGVTAKSWQGWLVTIALVVLIAISVRWLGPALSEMSGVDRVFVTPLIASLAMSLSSILVVANALRLDAGRAVASAEVAPRPTGRLVVADEPGE